MHSNNKETKVDTDVERLEVEKTLKDFTPLGVNSPDEPVLEDSDDSFIVTAQDEEEQVIFDKPEEETTAKPDLPEVNQDDAEPKDNGPEIPSLKQDVTISNPMLSDATEEELVDEFKLPLPTRVTPDNPDMIEDATEEEIEWDSVRVAGFDMLSTDKRFLNSLSTGNWTQHGTYGDVKGKIRRGIVPPNPGKRVPFSDINLRIKSAIGTGGAIQLPLVNSGFYITLSPQSERNLNVLLNTIISDKEKIGRDTFGASFSNHNGVTSRRFFNFIMDHVTSHTLKDKKVNIKNYIKKSDMALLEWAFVTTMYPNGHYYQRACTHDSNKCHHVKSGKVNLANMLIIKDSAFTDKQRMHMCHTDAGSMTLKEVLEYQKSIEELTDNTATIEVDGVTINYKFKDGYCLDWFRDTDVWIDNMHNIAIKALGKDPDSEQRIAMISQLADAAELRTFASSVAEISGSFGFVDDERGIRKALEALSSSYDIKEKTREAVNKYIDDSALYVIGIENYTCPACNKPQLDDSKYIIPVDVLTVFFTILATRLFAS